MVAPSRRLPQPMIALLSHLELQNTEWWKEIVESLILTILYHGRAPMNEYSIKQEINGQYGADISIDQGLIDLQKKFQISKQSDQRYIISDSARRNVQTAIIRFVSIGESARETFESILSEKLPNYNIENIWETFLDEFIVPTVINLGVDIWTFALNNDSILDYALLLRPVNEFLQRFPPDVHVGLRAAVTSFLILTWRLHGSSYSTC